MAWSDSSSACLSGLWPLAFPDRPAVAGALEVSRFSCPWFPDVPGVCDYAESGGGSRISPFAEVAFPRRSQGRHSDRCFRSSIPCPPVPLSTLRSVISRFPRQDSRSRWSRYSFLVGLFHPLPWAGLSRRSTVPLSSHCPKCTGPPSQIPVGPWPRWRRIDFPRPAPRRAANIPSFSLCLCVSVVGVVFKS